MASVRRKRSERLLSILDEYAEALVVAHNNPDPDAIAAGWALVDIVAKRLKKPARLVARGPILRAENRRFIELLQPPIELVDEVKPAPSTATILVDCAHGSRNHLLAGLTAPVAVIDHHEQSPDARAVRYSDTRPKVTASASIATGYIRELGVEPHPKLATGLLYAIRTEMIGAGTPLSRLDHTSLRWLSAYARHDLLSQIENPPLPRHYYEELALGLDSVILYGESAICFLPRLTSPELVGEMADLLLRYDRVSLVLCGGRSADELLLSARSSSDNRNALDLLKQVVADLGHCGGHRHRAGGSVLALKCGEDLGRLEREVKERWLKGSGASHAPSERLVRENLDRL